jgi:hypothetical protein
VFDETLKWIEAHGIFPDNNMGSRVYEQSVIRLA